MPDRAEAYSYGPVRERVALGDWRLTIEADRFSGERRCRLAARKGYVGYSRGTLAIRLPGIFDRSEAIIRVDGGAPIRWRDLIPELAELDPGFAGNRDARLLTVPAELMKNARTVAVSPAFGKRAQTYRIAGLDAALEQAVALGCRPDAAFVR